MDYKHIFMLILFCVLFISVVFSGCTTTFTANDSLQLNILQPSDKTVSLISEFESGEASGSAGDVTQKAGSVCAGGACIIY
ncbi:MAG: hypothetical protein OXD54_12125 [Candidatus Poribacteria bacterium]|nr:hypothetical protein [Candidatus Poribacteria bacterium]